MNESVPASFKRTLWESKNFRFFIWTLIAVFLLAVCLCTTVYLKYRSVARDNPEIVTLNPPGYAADGEFVLGTVVPVTADFRVPWNKSPITAEFVPADGIQTVRQPEFVLVKYSWGANVWQVRLLIQPYRDGTFAPGKLTVVFSGSEPLNFDLPEISAVPKQLAVTDDLETADEMMLPAVKKSWTTALIAGVAGIFVIVLVILTILRFFKRTRESSAAAFWEIAMDRVRSLRDSVRKGNVSPEQSLSELTDVVRHYLELRFLLRAERQTTAEFLRDLERDDSPLPEDERRFLKNFLTAADMVKYARVPSDPDAFDSAAVRAEKLIIGTAPDAELNLRMGKEAQDADI